MEQLRMLLFGSEMLDPEIPEGYLVRSCREGNIADGEGWCHACETLNEGRWTYDQFVREMVNDPECGEKNIFLICRESDGAIAGTATAKNGETPVLHMVGMSTEFMGKGLCRPVCIAALNAMTETGAHRIQLKTDEFRIPAIKSYLRLGFRPWYFEPDMQERWRGVFDEMGIPYDRYFAYNQTSFKKIPV